MFALFAVLVAAVGGAMYLPAVPEGMLRLGITCVLVFIAIMLLSIAWRVRSQASVRDVMRQLANRYFDETPNEHFLSRRTLTLEVDGMREQLPLSHSFTCWNAYERFAQDDEGFYLYDSAMSGTIVPRTAFANQSQFLGYAALAERLWKAARKGERQASEAAQGD